MKIVSYVCNLGYIYLFLINLFGELSDVLK